MEHQHDFWIVSYCIENSDTAVMGWITGYSRTTDFFVVGIGDMDTIVATACLHLTNWPFTFCCMWLCVGTTRQMMYDFAASLARAHDKILQKVLSVLTVTAWSHIVPYVYYPQLWTSLVDKNIVNNYTHVLKYPLYIHNLTQIWTRGPNRRRSQQRMNGSV